MCYHHSIVTKHPLNFANCFTMRITKLLAKFDAVSLLNSFSRALTTAPHLATSNQQLAQANAVKKFKHVH
ncbi:hypothetical protein C0J52_20208 [Blattella germanica]|nr:hypothetical protein C0J52_20208 [Blattella germanica]